MIAATTMMWMAETLGYDTAPMEGFDEEQARYLETFRREVGKLSKDGSKLSDSQLTELFQTIEPLVPGGKLAFMIKLSANAVAAELARR